MCNDPACCLDEDDVTVAEIKELITELADEHLARSENISLDKEERRMSLSKWSVLQFTLARIEDKSR